MKSPRRKLAALGFYLMLACFLVTKPVLAAWEPEQIWFSSCQGSSDVTAFIKGEEDSFFTGVFSYLYPADFQLAYGVGSRTVTVTSHQGFLEVQSGGEHHYGYDQHWLFHYFNTYLFPLFAVAESALEFSGSAQIASFDALRYFHKENPDLIYWFDQATGIPLLIQEGTETILVIHSHTVKTEPQERTVELKLSLPPYPAATTFARGQFGWEPRRLVVEEPGAELVIEFSNWDFHSDWTLNSSLALLQDLKVLNDNFLVKYQAGQWREALSLCEQMQLQAPDFWQVYLYQAFVYEKLDNFFGVVENYQQVLMRDPDNALALNNLAYHYFLKEIQIPQALEMAERAVQLERKSAYLDTLGYGYYLMGRYQEAEDLLLEALIDAPAEALEEIEGHLELVRQVLEKE